MPYVASVRHPGDKVNIKQLEAFLAIVREGSFAAAADRLSLTQSTISARIHELEDELGAVLFDRSKRQVQLTYRGRELVRYAERASNAFQDIKRKFCPSDGLSGIVRVGVIELIAVTWLSELTALMRAHYPRITPQFEVSLNPDLFAGVRDGTLDIALMAYPPEPAGFNIIDLGYVELAWMGSGRLQFPEHPLTPKELAQFSVVLQGTESFTANLVKSWLGPQDNFPYSVCNSMAAIASLTEAGAGVSLLSKDYYKDSVATGRLQVLKTDPPAPGARFYAVHKMRQEPDELLETIADLSLQVTTFQRNCASGS